MNDDWAYAPTDPADRALAGRDAGNDRRPGAPAPARGSASATPPSRTKRPQRRLRADPGARSWALLIDVVLFGVVAFSVVFVTFIVSTPFWDVPDAGDTSRQHSQANGVANASVYALNETVPSWVSWLIVGVLAVVALLLSGAFSGPGRRRSLGLVIAELRVVRWPLQTTDPAELPAGWEAADVEPDQLRVAARWILPLLLFAVLSLVVSGLGAALLALAGWAPSLVGARRSLYDLAAGVAVVDAVRLAGLQTEVRALETRSPDAL